MLNMTPYHSVVRDFVGLADALNRMVERDTQGSYDYARNGGSNEAEPARRLPIDAWATPDEFVLQAYVPGVNPEQVEITFEGDELAIRGSFQPVPENTDFVKRELFHGAFERRITFNVPVNAEAIEATHEHGVLTLRVPKAEAVKPKQIKVVAK